MRKAISDECIYEQMSFHGMCYLNAFRFGVKYNQCPHPTVGNAEYGILAPMPDKSIGSLYSMALK